VTKYKFIFSVTIALKNVQNFSWGPKNDLVMPKHSLELEKEQMLSRAARNAANMKSYLTRINRSSSMVTTSLFSKGRVSYLSKEQLLVDLSPPADSRECLSSLSTWTLIPRQTQCTSIDMHPDPPGCLLQAVSELKRKRC
jgi:hypothetical protein